MLLVSLGYWALHLMDDRNPIMHCCLDLRQEQREQMAHAIDVLRFGQDRCIGMTDMAAAGV